MGLVISTFYRARGKKPRKGSDSAGHGGKGGNGGKNEGRGNDSDGNESDDGIQAMDDDTSERYVLAQNAFLAECNKGVWKMSDAEKRLFYRLCFCLWGGSIPKLGCECVLVDALPSDLQFVGTLTWDGTAWMRSDSQVEDVAEDLYMVSDDSYLSVARPEGMAKGTWLKFGSFFKDKTDIWKRIKLIEKSNYEASDLEDVELEDEDDELTMMSKFLTAWEKFKAQILKTKYHLLGGLILVFVSAALYLYYEDMVKVFKRIFSRKQTSEEKAVSEVKTDGKQVPDLEGNHAKKGRHATKGVHMKQAKQERDDYYDALDRLKNKRRDLQNYIDDEEMYIRQTTDSAKQAIMIDNIGKARKELDKIQKAFGDFYDKYEPTVGARTRYASKVSFELFEVDAMVEDLSPKPACVQPNNQKPIVADGVDSKDGSKTSQTGPAISSESSAVYKCNCGELIKIRNKRKHEKKCSHFKNIQKEAKSVFPLSISRNLR